MNIAVILAGGTGKRLGGTVPKQFIEVLGKPILIYTLEKFQNNPNIDAIEIVCLESYMDHIKELVQQYGITKVKWYAPGGETFQMSAMNGLFFLKGQIDPQDIVLLLFGVSPMISDEIINDAIRVCKTYGNAVAADEMIMCTCIKDDEISSSKSILRETLVGLNTPWTFYFGDVCEVYETAQKMGILDHAEPHTTSLYFALGKKLYFSKSATNNIKITREEDLELFEGYLLVEERKRAERRKEQHDQL